MEQHYIILENPNYSVLVQSVADNLEYMQALNKIPYCVSYGQQVYDSIHYMVIHYKSIGA